MVFTSPSLVRKSTRTLQAWPQPFASHGGYCSQYHTANQRDQMTDYFKHLYYSSDLTPTGQPYLKQASAPIGSSEWTIGSC